jgi:GH24 family phage-related lysozyme (muramidase)
MEGPKGLTPTQKATGASIVTIAIAAAVVLVSPLTEKNEGYRGKAYYDPAHILTQCYGETQDVDPSVIYSQGACAQKLRARMRRDYGPVIAKCMPVLVGPDWPKYTPILGAAIDAAYNAGPVNVCNRMGPHVNAGNFAAACDSLPGWFTSAKNRKTGVRVYYKGLIRRRNEEQALCWTWKAPS